MLLLEASTIIRKLLRYHVEIFHAGFAEARDDLLETRDVGVSLLGRLTFVTPATHLGKDLVVCSGRK